MYPYLTGAGSWMMLTMQTRVFGIRGDSGDLLLNPMLTAEQFDENGQAAMECRFNGRKLRVVLSNPRKLDWGEYAIESVEVNGQAFPCSDEHFRVSRKDLPDDVPCIEIQLNLAEK